MIHLSYFRCLNWDGNVPCSDSSFLSMALRWDQGDKLKCRHFCLIRCIPPIKSQELPPPNPHYIELALRCFWREAIWGCEGGATSTRRAWPATGDFLSHGRSRYSFYHAAQCGTDSWVTLRKKISALPAENNSPFSPSQTGSYDHYIRGKLNFFLSLFLAWENNGCLALFLPSLLPVICAFPSLCCKAINSTSKRDKGQQKEETTSTAMAETISAPSMHRVSCLTSFTSKSSTEKHCGCAS